MSQGVVTRKWPIKTKAKNIIIGDPRTLNISQGVVTRKALDKRTTKTRGVGDKLDQPANQSSMSHASQMVCHLCADGPTATRGHNIHTPLSPDNQKRVHRGRALIKHLVGWSIAGPTFDQLLFKYANKKVVLHDQPPKRPPSPAKIA